MPSKDSEKETSAKCSSGAWMVVRSAGIEINDKQPVAASVTKIGKSSQSETVRGIGHNQNALAGRELQRSGFLKTG